MASLPYIGLRPFEESDHALFFGREEQVVALIRKLEDHHFVTVVGSSGSGKSSLVRAGLIPALREGFMAGIQDWLTLTIRPGKEPYLRLADALWKWLPGGIQSEVSGADKLASQLRRSDRELVDVLERHVPSGTKTLVVVDQFEELFAFRRANVAQGTVAPRDVAAAFVNMLLYSCRDSGKDIWVVLTLRSDFSGDCEAFLGLPEAVSQSQFLVPRLTRWQMQEAILGPSQLKKQSFAPFAVSDALVNRIINDAGDRPDQLPLMQHVLLQTWKIAINQLRGSEIVLNDDHYRLAGGIEQALSQHADDAWKQISGDPRKALIACRLFLLLCEVSQDGQVVRRRTSGAELAGITDASMEEINGVVRLFQDDDRNFIVTSPEGLITPDTIIDVSHEALLRRWGLFANEWLAQERADAAELRRLTEQAELPNAGVLSDKSLLRVEAWRERVSRNWALRYVSADSWERANRYIEASREAARQAAEQLRRQKAQRGLLVQLLAVILIAATVVSSWAAIIARKEKKEAEDALTTSYVRVIGFNNRLSSEEAAALWDLAELDDDHEAVRRNVVESWLRSEKNLTRALERSAAGLLAATGLKSGMMDVVRSRGSQLIRMTPPSASFSDVIALENLVNNVGGVLSQDDIRSVVGAVVMAAADETEKQAQPSFFAVSALLHPLGRVLDHLQDRSLAEDSAGRVAKAVVGLMKTAWPNNADRLTDGATVLASLSEYAQGPIREAAQSFTQLLLQRAPAVEPAVFAMVNRDDGSLATAVVSLLRADRDAAEREALARRASLAIAGHFPQDMIFEDYTDVLLGLVDPQSASGLVLQAGTRLVDSGGAYRVPNGGLRHSIFERMNRDDATTLATRLVGKMTQRQKHRADLQGQARFLAKLLPLARPDKREELATVASLALEKAFPPSKRVATLRDLEDGFDRVTALADLAPFATAQLRQHLTNVYTESLKAALATAAKLRESGTADYLASMLIAWAPAMDAGQRGKMVTGLVDTVLSPSPRGAPARVIPSYHLIIDLAPYLDGKDAGRLASFVEKELLDDKNADSFLQSRLENSMNALAKHMDPGDAVTMADRLIKKAATSRGRRLDNLAYTLVDLVKAIASRAERARVSRDAAQAILLSVGQSGQRNIQDIFSLGYPLGVFGDGVPDVRLLALSYLCTAAQFPPTDENWAEISGWVHELTPAQLIEVLKWPVCGGNYRDLALADLAKARHLQVATPWEFAQKASEPVDRAQLQRAAREPRVGEVSKELVH